MALPVVTGASILCTMGAAPGQLKVTSQSKVLFAGMLAATIFDAAPIINLGACGMCSSMANPVVAAQTAAALGVLTPAPCVPAPVGAWNCTNSPLIAGQPGLQNDASLSCAYGGSISICIPGQAKIK